MTKALLIALSVFTAALLATQSQATARTVPPMGFLMLCVQHPGECRGGGAEVIDATADVMDVLRQVNVTVNTNMRPKSDRKRDLWSVGVSEGDCEDFVLAKRRQLIDAGLPPSSLRIATVKTRSDEGHAVLVVNTTRGQFVLDNLAQAIRPFAQTGYRLMKIQSANPNVWL